MFCLDESGTINYTVYGALVDMPITLSHQIHSISTLASLPMGGFCLCASPMQSQYVYSTTQCFSGGFTVLHTPLCYTASAVSPSVRLDLLSLECLIACMRLAPADQTTAPREDHRKRRRPRRPQRDLAEACRPPLFASPCFPRPSSSPYQQAMSV